MNSSFILKFRLLDASLVLEKKCELWSREIGLSNIKWDNEIIRFRDGMYWIAAYYWKPGSVAQDSNSGCRYLLEPVDDERGLDDGLGFCIILVRIAVHCDQKNGDQVEATMPSPPNSGDRHQVLDSPESPILVIDFSLSGRYEYEVSGRSSVFL